MKKFVAGCLISAGIMMAVALMLSGIYWMLGGPRATKRYLIEEKGKLWWIGDVLPVEDELAGLKQVRDAIDKIDSIDEIEEMADILHGRGVNLTGQLSRSEEIPISGIKSLELELGAGEFIIEEKDEDDQVLELVIEGNGNCNYSIEHYTLHMEAFQEGVSIHHYHHVKDNRVCIKVPKNFHFDEVELNLGAGVMDVDALWAMKAELEVGAGELRIKRGTVADLEAQVGAGRMTVKDMSAYDAEISVGMGECIYEGSISGKLEADCSMGNLEMELTGTEEEHNYILECDMGNMNIGKTAIGGISTERQIDNGAGSTYEVSCSMGNIAIRFKQ